MSITAAQLVARVSVEGDAEAKAKLQGVGQEAQQTGEKAKEAGGGLGGMFKNALAFAGGQAIFAGLGFLKDQISGIFTESMNAQAGMAQTVARLKDTGDASGMTAQAIADLATQYSHLTVFSDDTIQSGENMLLTFRSIGKDVFPTATHSMLELAQVMGGDMQGAAVMLGKAMDDPVQGISALHRVGVSFTDSQKDMIKQMMAVGNQAGAQKEILKILADQGFGSAAEAAGKTFGGQLKIAQQRLDDLKQTIGDKLMPILAQFLGFVENTIVPGIGSGFTALVNFLKPFGYFLQYVGSIATSAFRDIGDTLTQLGQIFKSVFGGLNTSGDNPIVMFFSDLMGKAYPMIGQFGTAFHNFMMDLQKNLSTINPQQIIGFFQSIGQAFNDFRGYAMPVLQQVAGIVGGQLKQDFQTFTGIVQNLAGWWQSTMVPAIREAMPGFMALGNVLLTQVVPALAKLWAAGHQIIDAILPIFIKLFETLEPIIVRVGGFISGLLAKAIQYVLPYIMQATQEIAKFAQEIATKAMPIITQMGTLIGTVLGFIMAHWKEIWGVLGPIVTGVFQVVVGIIKVAWSLISGIFKIALDLLSGNWRGAWNDMKGMLGGIFDGIGTIIHGALGGLLSMLGGFFGNLASRAIDWGLNIIRNLASGIIGGIWSALSGAMNQIGSFISSHLPSSPAKIGPLRDLATQGAKIPEQIGQGMVTGMPKLQSSLNLMLAPMAMAPMMSPGSGGGSSAAAPIHVNVYLDGAPVAKKLMPHIASQIKWATGAKF